MVNETALPFTLYIHAANVHQGGGRALLEPLLNAIQDKSRFVMILDERMSVPEVLAQNTQVHRVKPTVLHRLKAERWLAQTVGKNDVVLCFGNLPPLFKLKGRTTVFVQNRYLIEDIKLNGFPYLIRLRLMLERLWLSTRMLNADEFVVQTPTMKRLLELKTKSRVPVRVLPFVAEPKGYSRVAAQPSVQAEKEFDFVYVASGEPHKNHRRLIEAWCLLAEEGCFPSLCLTLDAVRFADMVDMLEAKKRSRGLKFHNEGELTHAGVTALYGKSAAAIYPSLFESFGLPLIEARQAGLPVLASELDYVRDVLDPEQSFDPESANSIARAVKRFLQVAESPLALLDASQFLEAITGAK